jgi:hypothetical protein
VLAAGLGRAGAARPSPPAPPVAPPGPPTRASGSATTTHRGRAPSRGRQPRGGCSHLALQPAPVPTAQPPATGSARRPGLPGRSVVKRGRRGPHPTRRPGSATDLPLANPTSAASPASRLPRPSIEPSTARQPPGPPPVPVVTVARPPRPWSQRHRLSMGGDGRVRTDGGRHQTAVHRMGGQQTAGQRTAGHRTLDGWTADGRRWTRWTTTPGVRTPDGWTAGSPTPKPDGWTPHAGQRRPTPWRGCWQGRPRRQRPTSRDRLDASAGRRRLGGQPPGPRSRKDAEGTHAATDGSGQRRDGQLQVVRRRPAGASAHCSPRTITGRG